MILYPGEVGVCSEQLYAWMPPQQVPGTLYLTNSRLVFEAVSPVSTGFMIEQALGLASSPAGPLLNLDVRQITNLGVTPGTTGWHTLRVEASGGAYVYQFQTPRAHEWMNSIERVRGPAPAARGAPPAAPGPSSTPIRSSGPPAAAPAPAARPAAAPGTVWCARCGKGNVAGATACSSCGASLG
jgi:hypothetical protein